VDPTCTLFKITQRIQLHGFRKLPKGLSTDGYGFASPAGTFLTSAIEDYFGTSLRIVLSKSKKSSFDSKKKLLAINHDDYLRILDPLRTFRTERNLKSTQHVAFVLHDLFPRRVKNVDKVKSIYTYEEDKISKILGGDSSIISQLSKKDIQTISEMGALLDKEKNTEFKYIDFHDKSKRKNERAFLETIVKEYEKRLTQQLSEGDWQIFFRKYILLFNTSYVKAIEKLNVDLRGKYPDFMLIDVFGYIDIFEIKKPSTNLLKHDDSRDNYFWDTETSKAIIQVEKYIQMLIKKDKDVKEIIKEKHGLEVKVVRPKGHIIVGQSSQFSASKMEDDFRLLSGALKNSDIVMYDELLNNLRNTIARLR
jgi:CRISPR/Cas system-associated protein Cas5 (RAMP superfamily)